MKRKFSKILGVGVTLALLTSLMVGAIPVSALSVPTVTIPDADDEISDVDADYTILFDIVEQLGIGDTITITFPDDTVITAGNLTATTTLATSPGWVNGEWDDDPQATATWVGDADDRTIIGTVAVEPIGEGARIRVEILAGITNPSTPGDYTLTVATTEEDTAVESTEYTIESPDVPTLPGIVEAYNDAATPILMDSETGPTAIQDILDIVQDGWTISIGEGLYTEALDTVTANVTIEGSGDLADIIIVGNWIVDVAEITLDNLTLDGDIVVSAADFTLQNSVVDDGGTLDINAGGIDATVTDTTFNVVADVGIEVDADATVISGSTFNVEADGIAISVEDGGTDTDVADSTFTGDAGAGVGINVTNAASVLDVEGSTFDALDTAVDINAGTVGITGNTISNSDAVAIFITAATAVEITGNTITGNDADSIIEVTANAANVQMMFNDIQNNAGDDDGLLIDNNEADVDLNVANNWWGDVAGPGDDAFSDDVISEPFLAGLVSADSTLATDSAAFDAEDNVGVRVTVTATAGDEDDDNMGIVAATLYVANPGGDVPAGTVANYWDVMVLNSGADVTEITIQLYTDVTDDMEVYVWGEAFGDWLEASNYTINLFAGFIAITVDATSTPTIADLAGLPFVVITPEAVTTGMLAIAQDSLAPDLGAVDVSVTPNFTWAAPASADSYEFTIAKDPGPYDATKFGLVEYTATEVLNGHVVRGTLDYSTAYYWRVRGVEETGETAGEWTKGDWIEGFFTTEAEPEEAVPAIVIEEAAPQPTIILEQPDIIVQVPARAAPVQVIPDSLLWVIIIVGAVLVIAVIVLIVRTRRVA